MISDILPKAEAKIRYGEEIRRASEPRAKATEQHGMKKVVNHILDAIGL